MPQAASPGGLLLAVGVFGLISLLPRAQFLSWGWRIPFLLSSIMLLVGLMVRLGTAETPALGSQEEPANHEAPSVTLWRTHGLDVGLAIGARLVETVSGNPIKSLGHTYATLQLRLRPETALSALTVTAAAGVLATPLFGRLGDHVGQPWLHMTGGLLVAILAFPFFTFLDERSVTSTWIAFIVTYNLGPTLLLSVQPALFTRMFEPRVRYTGMSVAYQVSAISGGFTPLCAIWLLRRSNGAPWLVAGSLVIVALVSCGCVAAAILVSRSRRPVLSP